MACVTQTLVYTSIILFNMDFHGMGFKWDTHLSSLLMAGKKARNYTLIGENFEPPQFPLTAASVLNSQKATHLLAPRWAMCDC